MKISASGVSLNVEDVPASTAFLVDHFGFRTEMAATASPPSPATTRA
jgi:catechol 2,3-dioxygenase-like lactoylglutathione lyase family enzyme